MEKAELLDRVLALVKEKKGVDFSGYRYSTLLCLLLERLDKTGCKDPATYLQQLQENSSEQDYLLSAFTVNYSRLFRNPLVFEILADKVLPEIVEQKERDGQRDLRVWSAGCAEGEEACSLAILIHQLFTEKDLNWNTYLFATDIDHEALLRADKGKYTRQAFVDTKLGVLDQYFVQQGEEFSVCSSVRDVISYSYDDLTSPSTVAPAESIFGTFDLILCRNVLIYFNQDVQKQVFNKILRSLSKQGYLVLGEAEFLCAELEGEFLTVDEKLRIYRKIG